MAFRSAQLMIAAAATLLAGTVALAQTTPAPAPAASLLPAGPGHDVMTKVCSGCHSPEIAARQRLTADGWKEVVETMASRGAQATDAELDAIVAYLSQSFPAQPADAKVAHTPG